MTNFNIKQRRVTNVTILDLTGEMNSGESGNLFCDTIHQLLEEGQREILLNLARVTSIDSSGLGDLIASRNTLNKCGGQVKLVHLTEPVRELMVTSKLLTAFEIYDTETDALGGLKGYTLQLKRQLPLPEENTPLFLLHSGERLTTSTGRMKPTMMPVMKNATSRL